MKALPLIALLALSAVSGMAAEAPPPEPLVLGDLTFEADPSGRAARIEVRSSRGRSTVSVRRSQISEASGMEPGSPDGPVRFSIVAEAGRADCVGQRSSGLASGTCRFASSPAFETGLTQRDIALERRRDLLSLALVDARLALVDDLSHCGFKVGESGNLIAATALGITGGWAHELEEAGLTVGDFNDLIAARALDVDGPFLRAMASAGYPRLSAHQAVAMKAVGVTPAYATAMNRAAVAAQALNEGGGLQ